MGRRPIATTELTRENLLDHEDGIYTLPLPALPNFSINMYLPKTGGSEIGQELARHIREQFHTRHHRAA